jgi:hypothetical protein
MRRSPEERATDEHKVKEYERNASGEGMLEQKEYKRNARGEGIQEEKDYKRKRSLPTTQRQQSSASTFTTSDPPSSPSLSSLLKPTPDSTRQRTTPGHAVTEWTTPGHAATERTTPGHAVTERTTPGHAVTERTISQEEESPVLVSDDDHVISEKLTHRVRIANIVSKCFKMFQDVSKSFKTFQKCFKNVSNMFQTCFRNVSEMFQYVSKRFRSETFQVQVANIEPYNKDNILLPESCPPHCPGVPLGSPPLTHTYA